MRRPDAKHSRRGVILLAVLVVIVLLSLAAYRYNDLMSAEYQATHSSVRAAQARSFADSGVAYVMSMTAAGVEQTLGGNPFNNPEAFAGIEVPTADPTQAGRFYVFSVTGPDEQHLGGHRFGLTDEGGKINLNGLLSLDRGKGEVGKRLLMGVPNMTEELANGIINWMTPADTPPLTPGGGKDETYSGMNPPYRCKNGPFDSFEELLLVQGVTADLLFGGDRNRNGVIDGDEVGDSIGWQAYLTVYSREVNAAPDGSQRINLNLADPLELMEELSMAVGEEMAMYIVAYRLYGGSTSTDTTGKIAGSDGDGVAQKVQEDLFKGTARLRRVRSIWDLIGSQVSVRVGTGGMAKSVVYPSPLNDPAQARELLPVLLEYCSTSDKWDLSPRLNINTCPLDLIAALKDVARLSEADIAKIQEARPDAVNGGLSDPVYRTTAWLVTEAGLKPAQAKALNRYVTGRSQVYRFQVVGTFDRPGPMARIEAVVDANNGRPRVVYWRDLSDLGRGIDLAR